MTTAPKLPEGLEPELRLLAASMRHSAGQWMVPGWDGHKVAVLLEKAQAALQALAAEKDSECETLRAAIRDHNNDCESRCEQRQQDGDAHCPYAKYGRQCPDCPRDGMVDAAIDSAIALAEKEAKQ